MVISDKVIRAKAVVDMNNWILNYENDGSIDEYDKETQKKYWEYIKQLKMKILKDL